MMDNSVSEARDGFSSKEDESDDEPITLQRKKKKKAILVDSDEESRESFVNNGENSNKYSHSSSAQEQSTSTSVLSAHNQNVELKSSAKFEQMKSSDYDSDKENINPERFTPQLTGRLTENKDTNEEDDEEGDHEEIPLPSASRRVSLGDITPGDSRKSEPLVTKKSKYDDLFDAEESEGEFESEGATSSMKSTQDSSSSKSPSQNKSDGSRIIKPDRLLSELFDAEESDDEEKKSSDEEGEERNEREDNGYESDEEMPREMSAALKKRLAKGAAKKPNKTPNRSHKAKAPRIDKDELQHLHSETQRMVREKAVHMPYHQPKKLGLDVFLARTKQKQEALQTIKGPRQVGWKKAQDLTAITRKDRNSTHETIDLDKKSKGRHKLDEIIESQKDATRDSIDLQGLNEDSSELPDLSQRLMARLADAVSEKPVTSVKRMLKLPSTTDETQDDNESKLEDMEISEIAKTVIDSETNPGESKPDDVEMEHTKKNAEECIGEDSKNSTKLVPLTEDIVSINLVKETETSNKDDHSQGLSQKTPELDSGYLTTPAHSSSDDSNSSTQKDKAKEDDTDNMDVSENNEHSEMVTGVSSTTREAKDDALKTDNFEEKTVPIDDGSKSVEPKTDCEIAEISGEVIETPQLTKAEAKRKLITPKLEALGLNQLAPRLSGGPDAFIDLDDDDGADDKPKADPGVMTLIQRFMKHSAKRPKAKSKDVEINSVSKQKGEGDKDELKLEKISYHIDSEEEDNDKEAIPGAKLLKLKSKLQEQMAKDRENARKLRTQAEQYENEEGFEEEEEAEMTDSGESEDEEEIDEEEEGEEEEDLDEEEYGVDEQEQEANPFVDKEAAEEEEEEYDEDALHLELDTNDIQEEDEKKEEKRKAFLAKAFSKTKSLPMFDDEDEDKIDSDKLPESEKKTGENVVKISERPFGQLSQSTDRKEHEDGVAKDLGADTSFELMSSMLPAGQRSSKKPQHSPSSPSASASSDVKARSTPFLPIENTQDLFNFNTSPTQEKRFTNADAQNENFNFHLEESQSVMLDDEGFLKINSAKKPSRRQLMMPEQSNTQDIKEALGLCSGNFASGKEGKESDVPGGLFATQSGDNMDDVMSLCSGQFTATPSDSKSSSNALSGGSTGFDVDKTDGVEGMSQLLGLCSGQFTTGQTQKERQSQINKDSYKDLENTQNNKKKKRKAVIVEEEEEEEEIEPEEEGPEEQEEIVDEDNFIVDSDVESEHEEEEEKNAFSDEVDENEEDDEDEEEQKFTSFFEQGTKKKKIRADFVDQEAELSGSEADSDENDDLGDEFDVMEEEAGDLDVNMTEDALRAQVGRVHQKTVQDEDDRAIRLMQEYYLPDGDLHSEGGGRQRRFRWAHLDDDMTGGGMDGSDNEDQTEDPIEEKWRVERFEREKFLEEQKLKETSQEKESEAEGSLKIGNVVFKQKKVASILGSKSSRDVPIEQEGEKAKQSLMKKTSDVNTPHNLFKAPKLRSSGSFLSRSKDTLSKIANLAKPVGSVSGPRNSRSLLFSTMSQEEKEQQEPSDDTKKPQLKRSISTPSQPVAKKQKLDRTNTLPANSIFKLLH